MLGSVWRGRDVATCSPPRGLRRWSPSTCPAPLPRSTPPRHHPVASHALGRMEGWGGMAG
eukprot:2907845-Rhodomonas_salina.1